VAQAHMSELERDMQPLAEEIIAAPATSLAGLRARRERYCRLPWPPTYDSQGREVYYVQPWNDKELARLRAGEKVEPVYDKRAAIIITGVPRAGRDPEPRVTSAPTGTPPTRIVERQPEGVALRVSTTLGERDLYMKEHHPRPAPPPDTSEPRYVRATISPQSEGHPGILIEGAYMLSNGTVQVFDMRGALLGTEPVQPGDDIEVVARRLLWKGGAPSFYAPLPYPPESMH